MPRANSLPWMESADAKMVRAHEGIEGVAREINEWLASIEIKIYLKVAPDNPVPWLVVQVSDYIPPIRLSVLIGECVHNMRSAVDNLVCGLALTLKSTSKCRDLAFPMCKDQQDWTANADKSLKGVPLAAKDAIRQLQPWADTVSPNPLTILNKLSNIDKHRACNFALAYGHDFAFRVHCNNGAILDVGVKEPLHLGDVQTIPLQIDRRLVEGSARVQASGKFVLTFREASDWKDIPVMKVLQDCFDHIEHRVVPKLKPFFETP